MLTKRMTLRVLALALCLSMAAPLASCGESKNPADTSGSEPSGDTTPADTEPAEEKYSLGKYIEKQDFGGMDYTILGFNQNAIKAIYVDEQSGSLVDDAVYTKIRNVEDHLNVNIKLSELSVMEDATGGSQVSKSVLSGEYEFDITQAHDIKLADLSRQEMFINLQDYSDIFSFDQPWWPANIVENLTVNGKMYLMSNNISYYGISDTRAMFFNKKLAEDYKLGNLYDIVRAGDWTFDKMGTLVKDTNKDVNNNSTWDNEDFYGVVNPYYYAWMESFGVEFMTENEDGEIVYDAQVEKTVQIVDAVHKLFFTTGGGLPANVYDTSANNLFKNGQAIFDYCSIRFAVSTFSQSDVIYGVLPFPKLDENQDSYFAGMTNKPCAIPVTVPEELREKVCTITEALNIEGYHTVFPAYFETALKARYADNDDDAEMFDIIHDNSFFAFSYLYGGDSSTYKETFNYFLNKANPSLDVASYLAGMKSYMESIADGINEVFGE